MLFNPSQVNYITTKMIKTKTEKYYAFIACYDKQEITILKICRSGCRSNYQYNKEIRDTKDLLIRKFGNKSMLELYLTGEFDYSS